MMMPSVAQERALALRRPTPWRRASLITQIVLFFLTLLGIAALYWLSDELAMPKGWITAIVSIVVAELLIQRVRFWRTGVESALWIGGLFAFIIALPSSGKPEAILVFVAAAAIAGWRVRNALFGTLALVLVTVYIMAKERPWLAAAFAIAVAVVALFAETRHWQRPSTEFLWEAALIVMPVAAYAGVKRSAAGDVRVVALFAALALLFLAVGVHLRLRVVLLAAVVTIAISGIEARPWLPLSDELCLILAGAIVLGVAAALMRALRNKADGFVLADERHELDDAWQIVAMLPMAAPTAAPAPHTPAGGGEFGGAGASGQF